MKCCKCMAEWFAEHRPPASAGPVAEDYTIASIHLNGLQGITIVGGDLLCEYHFARTMPFTLEVKRGDAK